MIVSFDLDHFDHFKLSVIQVFEAMRQWVRVRVEDSRLLFDYNFTETFSEMASRKILLEVIL